MMMDSIRLAGWDLPDAIYRRLGNKAGRQRAMSADGHLLLVLHEPPADDHFDRKPRLFWRPPDGRWRSTASALDGLQSLRRHVEEFAHAVERLEGEAEAAADADSFYRVLRRAAPVHRTARNLHAALQQAREAAGDEDRDLIVLRDRAGEVERAAELLHADAKVGLEYSVARQVEAQTRASLAIVESGHRLNVLAAVFLPLTAISAALGMNLHSGIETVGAPWLYWVILVAGLALGSYLRLVFSRGRG